MDNANTKQKLIVQIVSLLLSIGLWFYVTSIENPVLVSDINKVPVEIVNADSLRDANLALVPNQEFYVSLKIEGLSQDLRKITRDNFEVKVDLSEYALKKGENKIQVNVVDFPSKINIKNSGTLSIKINIEDYVVKDIPIKSNIETIAKPNYYVAPAVFNPATVKVSGPNSLVEKVDVIVAEGQEANVSETIVKNYNITPLDVNGNIVKGIELSEESVEATIKINEGKTVPIKVKTIGALKSGLKLGSYELSKKEIEISGPQDLLDTIGEISTEAIDLSTISDNVTLELDLEIPNGIQTNTVDRVVNVNVNIEKATTKEYSVPFTVIGLKEGLKIETKSDTIKVKVYGFEDELNKISTDNIKVELDVSKQTEPGTFSEAPKVELIGVETANTVEALENISYEIVLEVQTEPTE